jgi:hypothetical protein
MPERFIIGLLVALLAGCALPAVPSSAPPATNPADPAGAPPMAPSPTAAADPPPTASLPTRTASTVPIPTLDPEGLEVLELEATGCPGGVALDWSPANGSEFHHYTALRSLADEVDTAYPPIAPAVDWGDSYVTDRFVTSAVDATLIPSEAIFSYRVMAYDSRDRAVAASPVRRARPSEVAELGALKVEAGEEGAVRLEWGLFGGPAGCFSTYRVLIGPLAARPETILTVISDQSTTELETAGLHPGVGYAVRVEAVRTTTLGTFVVGRTEMASYTVP